MKRVYIRPVTRYSAPSSWRLPLILFFLFLSVISCIPTPHAFTLSVTNLGTGSGNINGAIVCDITSSGSCSNSSLSGSVSLSANPDWKSVFVGWGSPCSGTAGCDVTLVADTNIPITFDPNLQAVTGLMQMYPNYATLAEAYAAAMAHGVVAANVYTFHEDLVLDRGKSVKFYLGKGVGGYGFPPVGYTTLLGSLTVVSGSVEIDALIIQ